MNMRNETNSHGTPRSAMGNLTLHRDAFPQRTEVSVGESHGYIPTHEDPLRLEALCCSRYTAGCFNLQQTFRVCLLWAVVIFGLTGCLNSRTIPVKTIFESQTCNVEAGIIPISNQKELKDAFLHFSSSVLGQPGPKIPEEIDFKTHQAFLVSLGSKPNTGYSLSLSAEHAEITDGKMKLSIALKEPDPGRFYAQMITSPCVLISVPTKKHIDVYIGNNNLE